MGNSSETEAKNRTLLEKPGLNAMGQATVGTQIGTCRQVLSSDPNCPYSACMPPC